MCTSELQTTSGPKGFGYKKRFHCILNQNVHKLKYWKYSSEGEEHISETSYRRMQLCVISMHIHSMLIVLYHHVVYGNILKN